MPSRKKRTYNSPSRDQAKAETRSKIINAVVRVILDDGIHAFTVKNVAHKAGVTQRTVYRYFGTREELLDGLVGVIQTSADAVTKSSTPRTIEDISRTLRPSFQFMSEHEEMVRAYVITSVALQWQDEDRRKRTAAFHEVIRTAFPHLPAAELRQAGAMIRSLASSRSWYHLTFEDGLSPAAAANAADWAVKSLVRDLRRRNRAAVKKI